MSAWQASSPHHGPGRDNKVGKEEMLGMLGSGRGLDRQRSRGRMEKMACMAGRHRHKDEIN